MPTGRRGFLRARGELQGTADGPNEVACADELGGNSQSHEPAACHEHDRGRRRGMVGTVNPGSTTSAGKVNAASLSGTGTAVAGRGNPVTRGTVAGATSTNPGGLYGNGYTYGYGPRAPCQYRAYGYGSGYRNRYYGRGYGYGRSQGYNRAIVGRLRSAYTQLARIDHDYQGHRVRAMHAISMAIRQLSHRSMVYSGVGFAPGMNNGRGDGDGDGNGPGGSWRSRGGADVASAVRRADEHALRTLQGINMQSGSQGGGGYTTGHARARGHIMRAIHELSVALSIR